LFDFVGRGGDHTTIGAVEELDEPENDKNHETNATRQTDFVVYILCVLHEFFVVHYL
jgi:hypothetical protein